MIQRVNSRPGDIGIGADVPFSIEQAGSLNQPQRVAAFVACDSSLAVDHPLLVDSINRRFQAVAAVSIEQRSLGAGFAASHPAQALLYAQLNHFNPSFLRVPPEAWRARMLALNAAETLLPTAVVGTLRCPVLWAVGRDDPIVPFAVMQELTQVLPGSEVCVIDGAAHSAYFSHPQILNPAVLDFLARRYH